MRRGPWSLCLRELLLVLQRFKALVADCAARSRTRLLLQSDEVAARARELQHDLATLLDLLPVADLGLADDVSDLLALASRQCRRAAAPELELKAGVLALIQVGHSVAPCSALAAAAHRRHALPSDAAFGRARSVPVPSSSQMAHSTPGTATTCDAGLPDERAVVGPGLGQLPDLLHHALGRVRGERGRQLLYEERRGHVRQRPRQRCTRATSKHRNRCRRRVQASRHYHSRTGRTAARRRANHGYEGIELTRGPRPDQYEAQTGLRIEMTYFLSSGTGITCIHKFEDRP